MNFKEEEMCRERKRFTLVIFHKTNQTLYCRSSFIIHRSPLNSQLVVPLITACVSFEVHLRLDIIDGLLSFAEHIECAVASDVHLSTKVIAIIHFFLLQSCKFQGGRADGRKALLLLLLLTEYGRLGQTLLVHLGNERVKLLLGLSQVSLCCLLLLVLRCFILERVLV